MRVANADGQAGRTGSQSCLPTSDTPSAAVVDAAILGNQFLTWWAFAFLVYTSAVVGVELVLGLIGGVLCGVLRFEPGRWFLVALYLGVPAFALVAATGGEIARRYIVPALFGRDYDYLSILFASIWGLVAGGVLVVILVAAARREGGSTLISRAGWAMVGLTALSAAGLAIVELTYGLRNVEGKNLIVISVDALRADHLSCYGYERPTSPNIDTLAEGGALFERAICQSPGSTASHASILTSLYPLTHGAWNVGSSLHEDIDTLQEHLRDRGYVTAFFANNYFLEDSFGFAQGFDTFGNRELVRKVRGAPLTSYPPSLGAARFAFPWRTKPGEPSEFSIDHALSWIEKNRNRKFFLFLHVMDPHGPYFPPVEFRHAFRDSANDSKVGDGRHLGPRVNSLTLDDKRQLVDLYDGEIAYADTKVGRLMDLLRRRNLEDETVVVFTSDHAEVLDEHGAPFNHGYLWDNCIRVPLLIHYPPAVPPGSAFTEIVQSIDIVPTVLSLIEEPALPGAQGADLTGLMRGTNGASRNVAFTLGGITEGEGYAITTPRWKLSWIDEEHVELYDLSQDPGETTNLAESEPDTAAALQRRLLAWVVESRRAAAVPRSETIVLERLDDETKDRLRTLGYMD